MKRIGIIGPESTGKTALAQALAARFSAVWEPEYARDYMEKLNRPYTRRDVEQIARVQVERELACMADDSLPFCFFDTELIVTKVWFLHCFGSCPDFLTAHLEAHPMDFYLLCRPDLPWEPDPVRENGDKRDYFFDWYEREINALQAPYGIVAGVGEARTACAAEWIENFNPNRSFKLQALLRSDDRLGFKQTIIEQPNQ